MTHSDLGFHTDLDTAIYHLHLILAKKPRSDAVDHLDHRTTSLETGHACGTDRPLLPMQVIPRIQGFVSGASEVEAGATFPSQPRTQLLGV